MRPQLTRFPSFKPTATALTIATLCLTIAVNAQTPTPPPAEPPSSNMLQSGPLPPGGPPAPQLQSPIDANATPIPSAGDLGDFSYAPSSQYDGVSVVFPSGGGEPVLVATDFLQASIQSGSQPQQVLQDARMFETLNNRVAQEFASTFYPDQSAGTANLPTTELSGSSHNLVVEQDPMAGPYARVKVTDKDGNTVYEGSVSAQVAERVLGNPSMDADQKIAQLQKADFQLPEQARQNFNNLSAEELLTIVAEKPEVQERSFIKMYNVFENERQKREARSTDSTATAATETPAISSPTRRPTRQPRTTTPRTPQNASEAETTPAETTSIEKPEPDGIQLPEIIGIILGTIAIGIFLFGFWKSRTP